MNIINNFKKLKDMEVFTVSPKCKCDSCEEEGIIFFSEKMMDEEQFCYDCLIKTYIGEF